MKSSCCRLLAFMALGTAFLGAEKPIAAACLPFDQARNHLGETQCVTGKVIRVTSGASGIHYLDFCEDFRLCTFSVVVFSHDMRNVGDVRQLAGKVIEIRGELKDYDDHAEIILENRKQLNGEAASLPPMPKNFDVEERGHFSAGQSSRPHVSKTHKKKVRPRCRRRYLTTPNRSESLTAWY
jgi:hypothetical protein